jgi:ammonium transporter Rh
MALAMIELIFYSANYAIGGSCLKAMDPGGSMYIHVFGAYFGLFVSWVYNYGYEDVVKDHVENSSNYKSNLFAFVGAAFLWLYWPSFNAALLSGSSQHRIVVNTVLSLTGSAFAVIVTNPFFEKKGFFRMEPILNATLAGGVSIGAVCEVCHKPWIAILIGFFAGVLSICAFEKLTPVVQSNFKLFDTAGINNLHALPGVYGSIIMIIFTSALDPKDFGTSLTTIYPAMKNRTQQYQACMQAAALALSFGLAAIGGILTGLLLRIEFIFGPRLSKEQCYNDHFWFEEAEFEYSALKTTHKSESKVSTAPTSTVKLPHIEMAGKSIMEKEEHPHIGHPNPSHHVRIISLDSNINDNKELIVGEKKSGDNHQ